MAVHVYRYKPTTRRTAHFSLEKNSKVNTKFFTSCFNTLSRRWLKKSGKNFLMTLKERRSRKHIHPPSSQLLPPPALASPPAVQRCPASASPTTSSSAAPANASPTTSSSAAPASASPTTSSSAAPANASPTTSSSSAAPRQR